MKLRKTDRLLKNLNKEKGRHDKSLAIVSIVMSILFVIAGVIAVYEWEQIGELNDSIKEKNEKIAAMKTDMGSMATQAAADQKEIAKHKNKIKDIRGKWLDSIAKAEDLKYWNSEYKKCASGLIEACKFIVNYCTDIDIPKLRACLKIFAKIIEDTKEYHIPKAEVKK